MQGIKVFIPTNDKIRYINALLKVGFHTIDFGSFVSPNAVPQMKDTAEVLQGLDLSGTKSKLLAIVANVRGAEEASSYEEISFLGFPLSVSETFQKKNTNKSIAEAFQIVEEIQNVCVKKNKQQVVYLSMGFGNPYGDPYDAEYIISFTEKLYKAGIRIISPSDTVGVSNKENIHFIFSSLIPLFPEIEFGAHLHSRSDTVKEKLESAYLAGCRRFDSALKGFGGCPMAADELTGNIATERMIGIFERLNLNLNIDRKKLQEAMIISSEIFPS
jgi:hydroxymethylglutaryl-CoA lyase